MKLAGQILPRIACLLKTLMKAYQGGGGEGGGADEGGGRGEVEEGIFQESG